MYWIKEGYDIIIVGCRQSRQIKLIEVEGFCTSDVNNKNSTLMTQIKGGADEVTTLNKGGARLIKNIIRGVGK